MPDVKNHLSVGELLTNNYRILGMAGAGGMGVVYRAKDLKLERTVALKFLPDHLNASDRDKARFLVEARTASSLDHPNIGVIHAVEETADGRTFIVMAFYEGKSLAQKIRAGPIPPREAVEIGIQIASGLAAAHARQIVHRDIKPSNVMLTPDGAVKIVDFGLAHVVSADTVSETGITGTIAYMSPEQTMGRVVDHRSDIWSFGVVLAEMLTGLNPIERETMSATVVAILHESPRQLDRVPLPLQQVVYKALSKDPEQRYQHCTEIIADLTKVRAMDLPANGSQPKMLGTIRATARNTRQSVELRRYIENAGRSTLPGTGTQTLNWSSGLIASLAVALTVIVLLSFPVLRERLDGLLFSTKEKHIAVLPFDNIGDNPENGALVVGLMDSLAGKLSNLSVGKQSLWVVPTSEVRRLHVTDPAAALKDLGATLVVKGSVQRDGKDVHLELNLIDTKKMRQVGSTDLEDAAGDLATLQDEAVAGLARLMNITVTPSMVRNTGGSVNPAAYEDYLTALGYIQRYDKQGNLDLALDKLKKAIHADPTFALGYAEIGEAYRLKYQVDQDLDWLTEAEANCKHALNLDDRLPAVYVTLGRIHAATGKHELALQEFQHALALNPTDAAALTGLANAYESSGRIADAEAEYQKAEALRSDDWDAYDNLGNFYHRQGKYLQAIQQLRHAIKLTPDNAQLYSNLAGVYLDSGDPKDLPAAEQALQKSIAISPSYPAYANLGMLYMGEKRYSDAASATEKALQLDNHDYMVWDNLMNAYLALKQDAKAAAARKMAEQLAEKVIAQKPQDAMAQSTLAGLYATDKLDEKALAKIQTSLALAPNDPGVLSNVGDAYELMGNRSQAIKYIDKSIKKGYSLDEIKSDPDLQRLVADPHFKLIGK